MNELHTKIDLSRLGFNDPLTDDDEVDFTEFAGVDFWGEQRTVALNKSRDCQSSICKIQLATGFEQTPQTPTWTLLKPQHVANKAPIYHNSQQSSYLMPCTSNTAEHTFKLTVLLHTSLIPRDGDVKTTFPKNALSGFKARAWLEDDLVAHLFVHCNHCKDKKTTQ